MTYTPTTQLPQLKIFQWSLPSAADPHFDRPIDSSDTTLYWSAAPKDRSGNVIGGNFLMNAKNSDGYTENIFVPSGTLNYDAQTVNFTVGEILTGGTSGATAYIVADTDSGTTGTLVLSMISGTFQNNETITCPSGGSATSDGTLTDAVASDGLSCTNAVRGVRVDGLDFFTSDSDLAVDFNQDSRIGCVIAPVTFVMMVAAMQGDIASGKNAWRVGNETASDIYFYAQTNDTNKPYFKLIKGSPNQWVLSVNGVDEINMATGTVSTSSGGIQIIASDISLDFTDTTAFRTTRNGNESIVPVTLSATGLISLTFLTAGLNEADTFFNSTDISAAEAETLTDGSNADSLHTHEAKAKTMTAGEDVDGSSTPVAVYISDGTNSRTSGRYYKCDANDDTNSDSPKFFGFAKGNKTTGQTDSIYFSDIVSGFTGLTVGADYYLSDTAGAISATPGTKPIKIGKAVSATEILIEKETTTHVSAVQTVGISATGDNDTEIECGFRPTVLKVEYKLNGWNGADYFSIGTAEFLGTTLKGGINFLDNAASASFDPSTTTIKSSAIVAGHTDAVDLQVTLTVQAISDTSYTIRLAAVAGGSYAQGSKNSVFKVTAYK